MLISVLILLARCYRFLSVVQICYFRGMEVNVKNREKVVSGMDKRVSWSRARVCETHISINRANSLKYIVPDEVTQRCVFAFYIKNN